MGEEIKFLINNASSQLRVPCNAFDKLLGPENIYMYSRLLLIQIALLYTQSVPVGATLHDQTWKNPAASSLYT